jgi:hypothetical protein
MSRKSGNRFSEKDMRQQRKLAARRDLGMRKKKSPQAKANVENNVDGSLARA